MALSNRERIGRALEALRGGLAPYVLREMKRHYRDEVEQVLTRELNPSQLQAIRQKGGGEEAFAEVVDADALLKLMRVNYADVFFRTLGHDVRSYVGEATSARHRWAHQQAFSVEDAARYLDTIARLLEAVNAPGEAEEVKRMLHATRREQFDVESRRESRRTTSEIPGSEGLRPWRDVVNPHPDVSSGRYQEAEFAADLAEVWQGSADLEYQNPVEFFRRTYLTEGMISLLAGAIGRMAGQGGDPVVRLQTVFGGGKTHSMLALYHVLGGGISLEDIPDGEKLATAAEQEWLPRARRAVLVGTALDASKPRQHDDGLTTRTLWGEMAYQISGKEGYDMVADADARGVAPGADTLKQLFDGAGSVLVLVDELVAYVRNLYGQEGLPAGSFDSNMTFIQNLTEAAKRSESSLVVVSIPVSERAGERERSDIEIGGEIGRMAADRLESIIGRVESIWKPVRAAESFEIVRRRLFSGEISSPARDAAVSKFAQMYRDAATEYPPECSSGEYERRLRASYPIHPELFDRLYEDWSTLETFQRTRGVLRLMAAVIHELWRRGDASPMILPGTVPLDAPKVANQFLRYLPEGWNAVFDTDVDGEDSRPVEQDRERGNLGRLLASRRVARTVFLGSAPSVAAQQSRGLQEVRVRLGCVQPGESAEVFMDALRRMTDRLSYLYADRGRYWYDTRPNINREAEDRAHQQRPEDVEAEALRRLKASRGSRSLAGVHIAPRETADVRDEPAARLVVLGPWEHHRRDDAGSPARTRAAEILDSRGAAPRNYRNALVFLAPDQKGSEDLEKAVRMYLAWASILEEEEQLNLDAHGRRQAQQNCTRADETLNARLLDTYRWLLSPQQEGTGPLEWGEISLSNSRGDGLVARAESRLVSEEAVIQKWSPALLARELERYFWAEANHVSLKKVRDDLFRYPYFPRLRDTSVLQETVREGMRGGDYFGYATSVGRGGRYEGLHFDGEPTTDVHVDDESVLIRPEAARHQKERESQKEKEQTTGPYSNGGSAGGEDDRIGESPVPSPPVVSGNPRSFRASVRLDPERPGREMGAISEEILRHLLADPGAEVELRLEITASAPDGLDERTRHILDENCNTLRFEDYSFRD